MQDHEWYFTDDVQAARREMLAAHERLRLLAPLGQSNPDYLPALERAMAADRVYFGRLPQGWTHAGADEWDVVDAEASRMEGFTPGDSDD